MKNKIIKAINCFLEGILLLEFAFGTLILIEWPIEAYPKGIITWKQATVSVLGALFFAGTGIFVWYESKYHPKHLGKKAKR